MIERPLVKENRVTFFLSLTLYVILPEKRSKIVQRSEFSTPHKTHNMQQKKRETRVLKLLIRIPSAFLYLWSWLPAAAASVTCTSTAYLGDLCPSKYEFS